MSEVQMDKVRQSVSCNRIYATALTLSKVSSFLSIRYIITYEFTEVEHLKVRNGVIQCLATIFHSIPTDRG